MLAPRRSPNFGEHRTPAPPEALKIWGRGGRWSDTSKPSLPRSHTLRGPGGGTKTAVLEGRGRVRPSQRLPGKGLSCLPHPEMPRKTKARPPGQPAPTPARGPRPGPDPAHKGQKAPAPSRGPGRGRGLTWPSPRHVLGYAPLAKAVREPGSGREQTRCAAGRARRTRDSSQLAGHRAARSRHLPPLKRRRRSGWEDSAERACATGRRGGRARALVSAAGPRGAACGRCQVGRCVPPRTASARRHRPAPHCRPRQVLQGRNAACGARLEGRTASEPLSPALLGTIKQVYQRLETVIDVS